MWGVQGIAGVLVVLFLLSPARAAVFDIAAGDVAALIAAINTANGNGEDNTITLAAGTYTLTAVDNDTDGPNGLPSITSALPLTLRGAEAESTIIARGSGAPRFRLLHVASTGTLLLEGLTLRGGLSETGGGIANSGTLALTHSTVANNTVFGSFGPAGGGIANSGTLTLTHSTVANNQGGSATTDPGGPGGGIANTGTATIRHSTISNNVALETAGGGIANFGLLRLSQSTVSGNRTPGGPGGGGGAGIANNGTAEVTHSTISDNVVTFGGTGGIGGTGTLHLHGSTVTNNRGDCLPVFPCSNAGGISGTTVSLTQTIVAGNTIDRPAGDCAGQITSLGHNLVGAGTGCPSDGAGDLTVDPDDVFTTVLGPLQQNGGPTQTHALLPGSPAIDAGDAVCTDADGTPLTTDQRGKPRPVDGNGDGIATCDIGAFEFFPVVNDLVALAADVDTTSDATPVPGGPAGTFTITATFTNTSTTGLRFLFFGVSDLSGGNLLLNADVGPGGVGATVTPEVAGDVLAPDASVTVAFVIGLQTQERFTFFVNVFGEPLR
jgi:hypothetical protein